MTAPRPQAAPPPDAAPEAPPDPMLAAIMTVMTVAFDPAYGEAWSARQVADALLLGTCHALLIDPAGQPWRDGPAAGFALLRSLGDEAELLLLAVAPAWRGRGLGAALLSAALERARRHGQRRMLLEMRRGNPAERLYRAHGFALLGVRPRYYRTIDGGSIDALTFARQLDDAGDAHDVRRRGGDKHGDWAANR